VQHALLVLDRQKISAIRLPDGSFTRDAIAALAHFPLTPRPPAPMPATPQRVAKLNELLAAGKVSDRNARRLVDGDRISDTPWLVVEAIAAGTTNGHADIDLAQHEAQRAFGALPSSHVIQEVCWRARLYLGTGEIPTNFDPLTARSKDLPPKPLLLLLDELSQEGWRIVHTSEDRTVSDATSSVMAIRYLLTRD
jgi:hypothetical protein